MTLIMYRKESFKAAFTLLEILIALMVMTTILVTGYSLFNKSGRYSKLKMDEIMAFGRSKRIAMVLHDETKKSRKIWYPNSSNPRGEYFVTEHSDGSMHKFYFDDSGNFVTRVRTGSGGMPKILVRGSGERIRLASNHFITTDQRKLEMYLKYNLSDSNKTQLIMEFFDSASIPK